MNYRQLSLNPLDKRTGDTSSKRHVSVGIAASPSFLRPNYMLQTKFRVFIYDQKNGNHIVKEGMFNSYNYGFLYTGYVGTVAWSVIYYLNALYFLICLTYLLV